MAAVFALVFIPALAAVGFMARSADSFTFGSALAIACFTMMTAGVFYGALRLVQREENASADA